MGLANQYKRIAVNTIFQVCSKVLSLAFSLISLGVLTRYLGTEKYGWFTLIFTYVSFFTTFADVGYNQTIVREFSRNKDGSKNLYATLFNFKLILIFSSVILAIISLPLFPYELPLKIAILIGIVATSLSNLGSYGTSILQSQLRLDLVAILDLFIKTITVALIILCVLIKLNFYFIIGTVLAGNLIGLIVEYFFIKDWIAFAWFLDKEVIKKIMKISIPVGITAIFSLLYFKIDTIMLSIIRTPAEVGIYGLAYKVLDNILLFWALIMSSIFPLLSKYHGNLDLIKYRELLKKTLFVMTILSFIIIFIGYNFTSLIMRALGGSKFFSSMIPFKILLISVPFLFFDSVCYNVILSFGKTKYLILPLVASFFLSVLINIYAIPRFGYIGASITTVITEIFISITYIVIFIRYFKKEFLYLINK